ncbi:MAG: type II toxin-antitoxin system HicB family antitoxin [Euryarchaeota archaeon]|nr:type II toxin-antitoxin system HicB family antitoxin [Euryarchaeota archaeon]NOQ33540.1 type II toxin-antitoxin system HicB family antitoxin [Methanosarcinales archaeon]
MEFNIIIEVDEDGRYVVECTDLPGCLSEGDTLKEAIENINEAIVGCLKSRLKVAGEQIKIPSFHRKLSMSIDITGTTYA